MATLMTITATFADTSSLTTTEAHEMTQEISKFLVDYLAAKKSAGVVALATIDYSAADVLTIAIT